jgi:NAD(P)-dependent dehydrogenase (short-subunit alcohol dehydrogenase family)
MKANTFKDHVVIITGASSGVGRALALALADEGAWLALAARDGERLEQLAQTCVERGGKALAVPTDVSSEEQCRVLVDQTIAHYDRLDMLVNNAGMGAPGRFTDFPNLDIFRRVMDVNFKGAVYCTYYALPHLERTRGRIVAVSSLSGKFAIPGNTSYVASKHAMQGFCDSLRMELALAGVSVTVISPYWVVTEFHERLLNREGKPAGKAGRAIYTERTMTAERCAQIILRAAARRKREVMMWPGPVAVPIKLIAPGLMDRLIVEVVMKPAVKRTRRASEGG